ncbi:3-(3-hydroxyphenyl)propionate hydroxylase [Mycolicibacter minnesotensis]|uniref:3-(3-hydroxyphenyl)propionate hydroxylase n=1 Tax=Mycolicibacter minnesotensis TaxID=1118379 RepID=A0AA91M4A3_9MYCO|nr:bifunctional 3-(3-hydroxy-phenyl)propionate/3-hydroxycinnamic acid hydroxylase [Mycolicibacter minnesotensis]ORA99945.1 3-(3-hydroxyphenyl)propionate hydroxylase [Mycolicibacter minnesotensis]
MTSPATPGGAEHVSVAIVGGGPTGITAATLLAQYGIDTLVLDRWPQVYPQPRAVHLDDEVYRILARLGVADAFAAISRPAKGLRLVDRDQSVLAEFSRDTALTRNGFPAANMFDQPELEQLLRDNLTRLSNVGLRGDTEVLGVAPCADGVELGARDRVTGGESRITADFVLGCDGANSTVRSAIGSAMRSLRFDQRWLVIDIGCTQDLRQWEGVHQVCDSHRAGTFMRIGPSRYRWEFALSERESADDYSTLTALRPLIAPWTHNIADGDLQLLRVAEYTFRAQIADRWRSGRVFLLGDAAHLTPPFIGQGMGAGLRDAMNLAWKIAGHLRAGLPASVLDSYEIERSRHTRQLISLALNIGRAMTAGGELGALVRRLVVPRVHLLPGLRDKITDSQTPPLRASAMVRRTARTRRLAGRLCPNPLLAGGRRLDAELGHGFGVVTAQPLTPDQQRTVDGRGAQTVFAAPGTELASWLGHHRVTAAVVRPDGTVMVAGRDLTALCRALPRFVFDSPAQTPAATACHD